MIRAITILLAAITVDSISQFSITTGSDFYLLATFKHGSDRVQSKHPFPWKYYEAQNIAAPVINIAYTKMHPSGFGMGISTGISFYRTKAVMDYSNVHELYSELNMDMINVPFTFRVTADISRLINQSFFLEVGIMNTFLTKYRLSELASIKTLDTNGDVIGEDFYKSNQSLTDKPFLRIMPMWRLGINVRRLLVGFGGAFTVADWYKPLTSTDVPEEYSMYYLMHRDKGKFKFNYMNVFVGIRITRH